MKRFISMLLLCCMIITSSGFITACSAKTASELTMGEWLVMVNQMFGMQEYSTQTPFFKSVGKENKYFDTVQIAAEWGVVDNSADLDVDKKLTYKDALVTLVNVGSFISEDAVEDDKVAYGIENFDDTIRMYWLDRNIEATKAVSMLAKAHETWANKTYKVPVSEIDLQDNVINCTEGENAIMAYNVDENGDVIIPLSQNPQINKGQVFILPSNGQEAGCSTYKAMDVIVENDAVRIVVDENIELGEVVEEIQVAETVVPTSDNIMIYDGNGNLIYVGDDIAVATNTAENKTMQNIAYRNVASASVTTSFEFDDFKIDLSYDFNEGFNLEAKVAGELHKFKNGAKLELEERVKIEDLEITTDYDFGVIKGLKSASLRIDYKTTEELGLSLSKDIVDSVVAPKYSNGNGKFLTNLKNSVLKSTDSPGAKTIKIGSFTIADAVLGRVCLDVKLKVSVDGKLSITVEEQGVKGLEYKAGKIRTISESDRESKLDLSGKIEGTVGIGPAIYAIGLKKSIVGASIDVGVGAKAALTLYLADSHMHLIETVDASSLLPDSMRTLVNEPIKADSAAIEEVANTQGVKYELDAEGDVDLNLHTCIDVRVYGIVKIGVETSYLKDILDISKIKVSFSILDDKNAMFARLHIDDFKDMNLKWGFSETQKMCRLEFEEFEENADSTETEISDTQSEMTDSETKGTENGNNYATGDFLLLSEIKTTLEVGETYEIQITSIPEGYSQSDLVLTIENKDIVTKDSTCKVKANVEGSTVVIVSTKDGKYSAYIAITVLGGKEII